MTHDSMCILSNNYQLLNTLQVDMAGDENPLRILVLCLSIFTTVSSYHWNDNTTIHPESYLLSEDYSDHDIEDALTRYKRSGDRKSDNCMSMKH